MYTLIFWGGENANGHSAAIHRTGCKDIEREARENGAGLAERESGFATVQDAINGYLDGELRDMGYDESIIHLPGCTK